MEKLLAFNYKTHIKPYNIQTRVTRYYTASDRKIKLKIENKMAKK